MIEKDLKPFLILGAILGVASSLVAVLNYIEKKQCEALEKSK